MSARDELAAIVSDALAFPKPGEKAMDSLRVADRLTSAGYRQIFDGDCGLSNIEDPTDREAAEAWMRWANIVTGNDGNGIAAMKQMLAEFGYSKPTYTPKES